MVAAPRDYKWITVSDLKILRLWTHFDLPILVDSNTKGVRADEHGH